MGLVQWMGYGHSSAKAPKLIIPSLPKSSHALRFKKNNPIIKVMLYSSSQRAYQNIYYDYKMLIIEGMPKKFPKKRKMEKSSYLLSYTFLL